MKNLFYANNLGDFVHLENGECYKYFSDAKKLTTNASGQITILDYKLNSTAYVQKSDKSAVKLITSASTTLSTGWNDTEIYIVYQLATPQTETCDFDFNLCPENNYITIKNKIQDNFTGDGTTKVFTLTETADNTSYKVYLSGIETSVTKTTTSITFATAPDYGQKIKVEYNASNSTTWGINQLSYEPSGTVVTLDNFVGGIQLDINDLNDQYRTEDQIQITRNINRDANLQIGFRTETDAVSFFETWKNKKFRVTLSEGSRKHVLSLSEIIGNVTFDFVNSAYTVGVYSSDVYES